MLQQWEQKQILITGSLACSLSVGGGELGLDMRWVQGSGQRVACPPLGGGVCRGHEQDPASAPDTSEAVVGFGSFSILSTVCRIRMWLRLVPSRFLVSVAEEMFVQVQALQRRVPSPRVPAHHRTFCCALGIFSSGWPDTHTDHHSLGGLSGIQPSDLFVEPPASPLGSLLDCGVWGRWGLGLL